MLLSAAPAAGSWAPGDSLPIDPKVRRARLPNGITYLLRENARPAERADLRLVVRAGSVDEEEDQRGLAHFVEHMVFNGTAAYDGNEIVAYLESIGARFGADLNASTSFDQTIYQLHVPTDREGLVAEGVRVLAEFAVRATLTDEEIDKERGVVLDEWRRGRGAGARIRDERLPVLLQGSRYAERLPIGLPEVIREAPAEAVRRFYRDWYRPERMAVIAVGDFDAAAVEREIRATFGEIAPTTDLRERGDWDVPILADTLFSLADDPEVGRSSVGISRKRPFARAPTYADYRRGLVRRAAVTMVNARLTEKADEADAPFLGASLGVSRIGRATELIQLGAGVRAGEEAVGLRGLLVEARRVTTHGFTETELARVKSDLLAGIEASYAEREKTPHGAYVAEYVRHFLENESIPGIETEVALWREMLPGITTAECHAEIVSLLEAGGIVVEATRPSGEDLVDAAGLLSVLRATAGAEIGAWVDAGVRGVLANDRGPAGRVTARREIAEIGVTEVQLANGVRVFLKPTEFKDDQVRFRGAAPGGLSTAADEDLLSAAWAGAIVGEAGYGGHTPIELGKLLSGKMITVRPFFEERQHGVAGTATVEDLPMALEMAMLVLTRPNRNAEAFARLRERLHANLENRTASPRVRFSDRLTAINSVDHPRQRPLTLERLGEIDPDVAVDFYEARFANAADLTFFLVGRIDVEALLPEIERTLGSLPSTGEATSAWVDRGYRFPVESVREVVRAGQEPKAQTVLTLAAYDGDDPREWHRLRTLGSLLGRRLRDTLREDLGATYGVSVRYNHGVLGPFPGTLAIGFGSDPAAADSLAREVFRALEEFRERGPTEEELVTEQEIQTRELETALLGNSFWLRSLQSLWIRERPLTEITDRLDRVQSLTVADVHRVARERVHPDRHTWVTWLPEEDPR